MRRRESRGVMCSAHQGVGGASVRTQARSLKLSGSAPLVPHHLRLRAYKNKKNRPLHNGQHIARRGRQTASSGDDRLEVPAFSLHLLKRQWGLFWLLTLLKCTDERVGLQAKGQATLHYIYIYTWHRRCGLNVGAHAPLCVMHVHAIIIL